LAEPVSSSQASQRANACEFGLGLTGITTVAAGERAEFFRLARWFLFLWLPWFTLGAVAWGALPTRRAGRGQP
jgi:hypothetical protein